mmetsp:Transcript_69491/g.196206  ORF Transcript_69491/g.196206 Transcript_69491/m.196206 type:complete len:383 (-) Transcript_69491:174-1322(-)
MHHLPTAHHQYAHLPPPKSHPADDCFGLFDEQPEERYIFVGECRGHFEQSTRGNFHYVGPDQGHYEKQRSPPKRTWQRLAYVGCILLVFAAVIGVVIWNMFLAPAPAFDCFVGQEHAATGWSAMKTEYCCENEGVACAVGFGGQENAGRPSEHVPEWLNAWLGDVSLGIKFTVSATIALMIGSCCGAGMYYHYLVTHAPKQRSPTEIELSAEIKKLLKRLGAKTGEIAITLMWDTIDDLDLHLKLPDGHGEISAENKEVCGGKLDVDGNHTLEMANMKPLENISWPEYDPREQNHPPIGEYAIYAKVCARLQHLRDPNITVALTVSGQQELFHQRITACCCEVKVCSFKYPGPKDDDLHNVQGRSANRQHDSRNHRQGDRRY